MKFVVKLFPEIMVKSKPVRKQLTTAVRRNIAAGLKKIDEDIKVVSHWDYIDVETQSEDENVQQELRKKLTQIPGIHAFSEVEQHEYKDFDDTLVKVAEVYKKRLENKTFVVRVKRSGEHDFRSLDLERFLGGGLLRRVEGAKVQLKNPDETVMIEVKDTKLFIAKGRTLGAGGFPVGVQGRVLSLISGGFDSPVASYLMMKRGCKVDYLFFNLGGKAHELGVKEICYHLNEKFSDGYQSNVITVDFSEIVKELLTKVQEKFRGVLLKRMMFKVANMITAQHNYEGLVTGESLAQVSSQTLTNLNTITEAAESIVFRPVLTFDKLEIINLAEKIETARFAEAMPEYCGVVSEKPATGASLEKVKEEEDSFDHILLTEVFEEREVMKARDVLKSADELGEIEVTQFVGEEDIIIDIREESEQKKNPRSEESIVHIPFFNLKDEMKNLDKKQSYLVFCEKGVMSKIHGLELQEHGFEKVRVYRPAVKGCSL